MNEEDILVAWEAYEFKEKTNKKPDWFWALGIIALAGSAVAFIYGNFLFGIFILLAVAALLFFGQTKPKLYTYIISVEGVVCEDQFYPFEKLHAFWLAEVNGEKKLLLKSEKKLVPIISLPFEDDEIGEEIYEVLSEVLPEEPLQEPAAHIIMDRLGF